MSFITSGDMIEAVLLGYEGPRLERFLSSRMFSLGAPSENEQTSSEATQRGCPCHEPTQPILTRAATWQPPPADHPDRPLFDAVSETLAFIPQAIVWSIVAYTPMPVRFRGHGTSDVYRVSSTGKAVCSRYGGGLASRLPVLAVHPVDRCMQSWRVSISHFPRPSKPTNESASSASLSACPMDVDQPKESVIEKKSGGVGVGVATDLTTLSDEWGVSTACVLWCPPSLFTEEAYDSRRQRLVASRLSVFLRGEEIQTVEFRSKWPVKSIGLSADILSETLTFTVSDLRLPVKVHNLRSLHPYVSLTAGSGAAIVDVDV